MKIYDIGDWVRISIPDRAFIISNYNYFYFDSDELIDLDQFLYPDGDRTIYISRMIDGKHDKNTVSYSEVSFYNKKSSGKIGELRPRDLFSVDFYKKVLLRYHYVRTIYMGMYHGSWYYIHGDVPALNSAINRELSKRQKENRLPDGITSKMYFDVGAIKDEFVANSVRSGNPYDIEVLNMEYFENV